MSRTSAVLVRVDLNVPMENTRVSDATRLERVAPTIIEIADKGGKVICSRISAGRRTRPEGDVQAGRAGIGDHSQARRGVCRRLHRD
jgi:3-phosphoglycerate kinase